ncbi:MAG: putative sufite oxidase [Pseudolabrys sp.]|jgi:DMSO/TMAO reductase YedYZ molybdopterin-dependent catalytic subunit|nr:putative sufite oxidase [Pseudolabrys sp.]
MRTLNRRDFLGTTAAAGAALTGLPGLAQAALAELTPGVPAGVGTYARMSTLPGKKPLIQLADRPPNYEAPLEYFRTPITPNDEFFVRYHLAGVPDANDPALDPKTFKISIGGDGANGAATLTLDDLKAMPAVEITAVNQCSGNRRGLSKPHVPGVEWGYGAMGCAKWKGAKLKDILDKVGVKKETVEVSFGGADGPVVDTTPDFVKSLPIWKAMDEHTIVAYEMNGAAIPHLNGAPARLIVPGWTGTYWMKHVNAIEARTKPLNNYWMNPAYRIPIGKFPLAARFTSQEYAPNTPITEMVINSLITSHRDGARVKHGKVAVSGIAWDGGYGIRAVQVSTDGGKTWTDAKLGQDLGPYAFRPWSLELSVRRGKTNVMVNALNTIGQTQASALIFNGAGYHNNVMQSITLNAA